MSKNRNDRVRATSIDSFDFDDDVPQVSLSDLAPIAGSSATDAIFGQDLPPSHVQRKELETENENLRDILNKSIVQINESDFAFRNFRLTGTGLIINGEITEDDANDLGFALKKFDDALQFWIGDWANLYLDDNMDDSQRSNVYAFLAEKFVIEHGTLKNHASVCRLLDASRRRDTLSFSHHVEIAHLPEKLKGREDEFLDAALENNWSVRQLRKEIQQAVAFLNPSPQTNTLINTTEIVRQFRDVTKLFALDTSKLDSKERDDYRGKLTVLRNIIEELETKLDM
jgi:hypothetical protein